MNDIVTNDLTTFGYRELAIAGDLLKAYAENGSDFLFDGVNVFMNKQSGNVFLSDEDFNVGVLEEGKLVQFYSCPVCGFEGTQSEAEDEGKDFENHNGFCSQSCEDENEGN